MLPLKAILANSRKQQLHTNIGMDTTYQIPGTTPGNGHCGSYLNFLTCFLIAISTDFASGKVMSSGKLCGDFGTWKSCLVRLVLL